MDRGDEGWFIYKWTGEEIRDQIFITFDVLNCEVILGEPSFQTEQLLIWKQFVVEINDFWERGVIHPDKEIVTNQLEFKFLDSIFDS